MAGNTFTQAFVIHRVVRNTKIAKSLLFLLDEDEKDVICTILEYGIKEYMMNHYNPDNDIPIINDVFYRIVSTFPQRYHSIVSYNNRSHYNNNFRNYKLLFKQHDLVCCIFQYLDRRRLKSLINCSLVDSIWLFNSFDPKSFTKIEYNVCNLLKNNYYTRKRIWQRFRNIECLRLSLFRSRIFDENTFVSGIESIKIEQLRGLSVYSHTQNCSIDINTSLIKMIGSRLACCNHLKLFFINIFSPSDSNNNNNGNINDYVSNGIKLNLRSCTNISVHVRPFKQYPVILEISNKCEYLHLIDECIIDENSDFSGIKRLALTSTQFEMIKSNQSILNIAKQCKKIEKIIFNDPTFDMISFWNGINNYLITNNASIHLNVLDAIRSEAKCGIFRSIEENYWKINKLNIRSIRDEASCQFIMETILTKKTIGQNIEKLDLTFDFPMGLHYLTNINTPAHLTSIFTLPRLTYIFITAANCVTLIYSIANIFDCLVSCINTKRTTLTSINATTNDQTTECPERYPIEIDLYFFKMEEITNIRLIDALLDQTAGTLTGLYNQFKIVFASLTNAIKARIPFGICIELSIQTDNLDKALQCRDLFKRIKDELFELMLTQVIDIIQQTDKNGLCVKKQLFKSQYKPNRHPKSSSIRTEPSFCFEFELESTKDESQSHTKHVVELEVTLHN